MPVLPTLPRAGLDGAGNEAGAEGRAGLYWTPLQTSQPRAQQVLLAIQALPNSNIHLCSCCCLQSVSEFAVSLEPGFSSQPLEPQAGI